MLDIQSPLCGPLLSDTLEVIVYGCRNSVADSVTDGTGVEVGNGTLCGIDDETVVVVEEEHHECQAVLVLDDAVPRDVECGFVGHAFVGSDGRGYATLNAAHGFPSVDHHMVVGGVDYRRGVNPEVQVAVGVLAGLVALFVGISVVLRPQRSARGLA